MRAEEYAYYVNKLRLKHEYDVKLWRHKKRTPNTNDHHMPLNEPPCKFSAYATFHGEPHKPLLLTPPVPDFLKPYLVSQTPHQNPTRRTKHGSNSTGFAVDRAGWTRSSTSLQNGIGWWQKLCVQRHPIRHSPVILSINVRAASPMKIWLITRPVTSLDEEFTERGPSPA